MEKIAGGGGRETTRTTGLIVTPKDHIVNQGCETVKSAVAGLNSKVAEVVGFEFGV